MRVISFIFGFTAFALKLILGILLSTLVVFGFPIMWLTKMRNPQWYREASRQDGYILFLTAQIGMIVFMVIALSIIMIMQ